MVKKVNKKRFKTLKYTLVTSACFVGALHFSLPSSCNQNQLHDSLKNSFQNAFYANEEECDQFLNGNQLSTIEQISIKKRDTIRIDLCKVNNLTYFEELTNIDIVEISNAQRLSSNDINILNNSNVEKIYLNFNLEEMIRLNNKFDFSKFKDIDKIVGFSLYNVRNIDEYYGVLILNYFNNISDLKCINLKKYEQIDKDIDAILSSINYKDNDTDFDIILKNMNYVSKHIEYDKLVSSVNRIQDNYNKSSDKEKKYYNDNYDKKNEASYEYNKYPLSSVLKDLDDVDKGVCINYATLYSILCIKKGIPVFRATGDYSNDNHAWNLYYPKEFKEPVYIDPTFLDSDEELFSTIKNYLSDKSVSEYIALYKKIYIDIKSNPEYNMYSKIADYYSDVIFNSSNIMGSQYELKKETVAFKMLLLLALYSLISYAISITKKLTKYEKENNKIKVAIRNFFFERTDEEIMNDEKLLRLDKAN